MSEPTPEQMYAFILALADMSADGDVCDHEDCYDDEHVMENDDAVEALNSLIADARRMVWPIDE